MEVICLMIEQKIQDQLFAIGHKVSKVNKIILFGSRAIGDNLDKSDIDLAFVAPGMTNMEWAAFTFDIEDKLDTLLFLDIVKFDGASPQLKNEIIRNGKVLYNKDSYDTKMG